MAQRAKVGNDTESGAMSGTELVAERGIGQVAEPITEQAAEQVAHGDSERGAVIGADAREAKKPRKHRRGSGRERVLDAYAAILHEEGESAATLDEVARRADISKGGLLHHFASKEALLGGLLDRLIVENGRDIERTLAGPGDPVTAYLLSCMNANDNYSQTYLAVMKLAGTNDPRVDEVLGLVLADWQAALGQRIEDPVLARLVQLLGDGLYSHALIKNPPDALDQSVVALINKLVAAARD